MDAAIRAEAQILRLADGVFLTILLLRFLQNEALRFIPGYAHEPYPRWVEILAYATSVTVIVIELKIWNGVRLQIKLEEQERLLLKARMTALQNQINPHFLFNTLNSVSSLVRIAPDTARELIIKLAPFFAGCCTAVTHSFLCRMKSNSSTIISTSKSFASGRDKLKVVKELDPVRST